MSTIPQNKKVELLKQVDDLIERGFLVNICLTAKCKACKAAEAKDCIHVISFKEMADEVKTTATYSPQPPPLEK